MEATAVHHTLLSAARNFIRKSSGSVVLVIAPLAVISTANTAHAQALFFTTPGVSVGGSGFFSSGYYNFFSTPSSGGNSLTFGANDSFQNQIASGSGNLVFEFSNTGGSGLLNNVPVTYDFNIANGSGVGSVSWHLDLSTGLGFNQQLAYGSGLGQFTGAATYNAANGSTLDYYELNLYINFTVPSGIAIMNVFASPPDGAGFTLNAIPEQSTYTLWLGLVTLGFVAVRRFRRAAV